MRAWFLAALAACTLVACGGGSVQVAPQGGAPQFGQQAADTFAANLTPIAHTTGTSSAGQGAGTVVLNADSRLVVAVVTTTGVTATSVTMRDTAPGTPGTTVVQLAELPPGSGAWSTTAALSDAQLAALRSGQLYFEVVSVAFPQGELRGQILPQPGGLLAGAPAPSSGGSTTGSGASGDGGPTAGFGGGSAAQAFMAALRGSQVAPPTPSTAQGSASAVLNPATGQLALAAVTAGMAPTSIVLREAETGDNGPVALALSQTLEGSGVWLARAVLTQAQMDALNTGRLYLEARSAAYPEGELRGQLLPHRSAGTPTFGVGTAAAAAGTLDPLAGLGSASGMPTEVIGPTFPPLAAALPDLAPPAPMLDISTGSPGGIGGFAGIDATGFGSASGALGAGSGASSPTGFGIGGSATFTNQDVIGSSAF